MNKMAARTTHITMMQVSKTQGGGSDSVIGPQKDKIAKRTSTSLLTIGRWCYFFTYFFTSIVNSAP